MRHKILGKLFWAACVATPAWAADGLNTEAAASASGWPQWQGRVSLSLASPWQSVLERTRGPASAFGNAQPAGSVLGDYYFSRAAWAGLGQSFGGFRATSGLMLRGRGTSLAELAQPALADGSTWTSGQISRPALLAGNLDLRGDSLESLPYLGLGYTGLSARGGWGFSADFGLVAQSPGSLLRVGRVLGGSQGLDNLLRDTRLAPVLQLGARYAF